MYAPRSWDEFYKKPETRVAKIAAELRPAHHPTHAAHEIISNLENSFAVSSASGADGMSLHSVGGHLKDDESSTKDQEP